MIGASSTDSFPGLYNPLQDIGLFHVTQAGLAGRVLDSYNAALAERVGEAFSVRVRSRISQISYMCVDLFNIHTRAGKIADPYRDSNPDRRGVSQELFHYTTAAVLGLDRLVLIEPYNTFNAGGIVF